MDKVFWEIMIDLGRDGYFEDFTNKELGKLFKATLNYLATDECPTFSDRGMKTLWNIIKRKIDKEHEFIYKNYGRRTSQYQKWRKRVFERDNYTCQLCGKHGGTLNAHHILEWAKYTEERLNVDNGITLCQKCHRIVHKKWK